MKFCRACLSTENDMVPMDDDLLNNYNLLTSLNIGLLDEIPQNICCSCKDTVALFVTFRKRCISSEATLHFVKIQNGNFEESVGDLLKQNNESIKEEIKPEVQVEDIAKENLRGADDFITTINIDGITVTELQNTAIIFEGFNHRDEELKLEIKAEIPYVLEAEYSDKYDDCHSIKSDNLEENVREKKTKGIRSKKKKVQNSKAKTAIVGPLSCEKVRVSKSNGVGTRKKKLRKTKTPVIVGSLSCGLCSKVFENESSLNNHLQYHMLDKYCETCQLTFLNWPQMFGHRVIHLPPEEKYCLICKKRYKTFYYLENHYMNKHYEGEKTKPCCFTCNIYYDTPKQLERHVWSLHSVNKFSCNECSQEFRTRSLITRHILRKHMDTKGFTCDQCVYSCNTDTGLKSHKIRKHSAVKIGCKPCRRVFGSQEDYDKHKCGATIKQCPICGKTIKLGSRLSRHLQTHNAEPKFKCDRCPATFKIKTNFINHKNFHDGNKDKACEFCPAKFYYGSALVKHRRIHTGEKPYVCTICGKAFTGGNNLKVHMRVHGKDLIVRKVKPEDPTLLNVSNKKSQSKISMKSK